MSNTRWVTIFPSSQFKSQEEKLLLTKFLTAMLRKQNRFKFTEQALVITCPTKDESFAVGSWISHENPLNRSLFFTVKGYDESGAVIFDTAEKTKFADIKPLTNSVRLHNRGQLTIPKSMRTMLNLVDGDRVTLRLENGVLVVLPSWRSADEG